MYYIKSNSGRKRLTVIAGERCSTCQTHDVPVLVEKRGVRRRKMCFFPLVAVSQCSSLTIISHKQFCPSLSWLNTSVFVPLRQRSTLALAYLSRELWTRHFMVWVLGEHLLPDKESLFVTWISMSRRLVKMLGCRSPKPGSDCSKAQLWIQKTHCGLQEISWEEWLHPEWSCMQAGLISTGMYRK